MAEEDQDRDESGSSASDAVDKIASKLDDLRLSPGGKSSNATAESGNATHDKPAETSAMAAQAKSEEERYAAMPNIGGHDEPDIFLDAPEVSIDELDLTVDELDFGLALPGEGADGETQPGANVHLGKVEVHIKGVMAEAHLQVDLRDISETLQAVFQATSDTEETEEGSTADEGARKAGERIEKEDSEIEGESAASRLFNEEGTIPEEALGDAVELGVEEELIERNGSWYAYGDKTIGQGREAVVTWFRENEEARMELAEELRFRAAAEAGEPLITDRTDDEGRTVRRVRDPSGAVTFEYVLDGDEVKSLNVVEE